MNRRLLTWVCLTLFCFPLTPLVQGQDNATETPTLDDLLTEAEIAKIHQKWDAEIAKLEAKTTPSSDPANNVILLGSSSIRLWENAAADLAPYTVIQRGYGGARYSDLAVYVERLIKPHQFAAAVIFVANDITGSEEDRTPEAVADLVQFILAAVRQHQPQAQIILVEVTPTPRRFAVWSQIRKLNQLLREIGLTTENVTFLPTAEYYLDAQDQPLSELFREDRLHQNLAGYAIWAQLIHRRLDELLAARTSSP